MVEDDDDVRLLVALKLERAGHEVQLASEATEALRLCLETTPDLVVLDVVMPGLDGLEALQRLRTMPCYASVRHTPVVLLTARARPEDVALGLATGADVYLTKPFSPRELEQRVHELLRLEPVG